MRDSKIVEALVSVQIVDDAGKHVRWEKQVRAFEVSIDWEAVAKEIGGKSIQNRSGVAREVGGAVLVKQVSQS